MTSSDALGTSEWLVGELCRSRLLDPAQLQPLIDEFCLLHPHGDAVLLAEQLIRRGLLTHYQIEKVIEGQAHSLLLGPYVLAEPIGAGSLGVVYRAQGKADGQPYAVKVLPPRGPWNVRRAQAQVRSFVALPPHPGVVPLLDVGIAAGRYYLVWPLLEGESLDAVVARNGRLRWPDAALVVLHLVDGLRHCRQHDIVHGMIKPSNVLIGVDGSVRLLDFGIGPIVAENYNGTVPESPTGSVWDCASPEILLDPGRRTAAGDRFSLGCVLFFCLTGRYPFDMSGEVNGAMDRVAKAARSVAQLDSDVPPQMVAIVERLLHRQPEARGEDDDELFRLLQSLATGSQHDLALTNTPLRGLLDDTVGRMPGLSGSEIQGPLRLSGSGPGVALRPGLRGSAQSVGPRVPGSGPGTAMRPKLGGSAQGDAARPAAAKAAAPPVPVPLWRRIVAKIAFWRPPRDLLSVAVFAPASVPLGEQVQLAIFVHCETPPVIQEMGRTYFPGHWVVGSTTLRRETARGTSLTFHLALPGIGVEQPVHKIVWRGQITPLPYSVKAPADCRPGEIVGVVSIAQDREVIMSFEFRVVIAAGDQRSG